VRPWAFFRAAVENYLRGLHPPVSPGAALIHDIVTLLFERPHPVVDACARLAASNTSNLEQIPELPVGELHKE
jgi:hypothetical protein